MSASIIDLREPAYREEHEIDALTKRIAELESQLEVLQGCFDTATGRTIKLESLALGMREHIYHECGYLGRYGECEKCDHKSDDGCMVALGFDERMAALGLFEEEK